MWTWTPNLWHMCRFLMVFGSIQNYHIKSYHFCRHQFFLQMVDGGKRTDSIVVAQPNEKLHLPQTAQRKELPIFIGSDHLNLELWIILDYMLYWSNIDVSVYINIYCYQMLTFSYVWVLCSFSSLISWISRNKGHTLFFVISRFRQLIEIKETLFFKAIPTLSFEGFLKRVLRIFQLIILCGLCFQIL